MAEYEGVLREYTLLGISEVSKSIASKDFEDFFGGKTVSEMMLVVREGSFYHFQIHKEIEALAKSFLYRIVDKKLNLDKMYEEFDKKVESLEKIYALNKEQISAKVIKEFFSVYRELVKTAYAAAYSFDYVDILPAEIRQKCKEWVEKSRIRGENIYKYGEKEFIPRICGWLVNQIKGDYTNENLQYLFSDELLEWIDKKLTLPSPEILNERKKLTYARYYPYEKSELAIGQKARAIIEEKGLFKEIDKKVENVEEFSGKSAYKGVVKGTVRIIMKSSDMKSFVDGEIIVSPMTDPSYLPIMKKALAFVTDEGGALCHAAIVARELKKPCIIGTKIATKVLKSGCFVEVNATKGTVRILK